jgi:hypothetical protein
MRHSALSQDMKPQRNRASSPPPPAGFISPMTWGVEDNVIERFAGAAVAKHGISFAKDT